MNLRASDALAGSIIDFFMQHIMPWVAVSLIVLYAIGIVAITVSLFTPEDE